MPKLTTDEKNLVCLALEEYAASFAVTLDREEARRVQDFAARLWSSRVEVEPGTIGIPPPQKHSPQDH